MTMDFDEMKVIWDRQDERPLYAVDERALRASVRRRSRNFRNVVLLSRLVIVLTSFVLGALFVLDALANSDVPHRLVSGAILLLLGAVQSAALLRTRAGEARFGQSVLGDVDRAIWRVDQSIAWARSLRWRYVPLFVVAVTIDAAFRLSPATVLMGLFAVLLVAAASASVEWEIRSWHLPLKHRFEAVRRTLLEEET